MGGHVSVPAHRYYAENPQGVGRSPDGTKFVSIGASMWWSVAALTTTGYGDITPKTTIGQFLAGFVAFVGLLFFALPAGIISSGFVETMMMEKQRMRDASHRQHHAHTYPPNNGDHHHHSHDGASHNGGNEYVFGQHPGTSPSRVGSTSSLHSVLRATHPMTSQDSSSHLAAAGWPFGHTVPSRPLGISHGGHHRHTTSGDISPQQQSLNNLSSAEMRYMAMAHEASMAHDAGHAHAGRSPPSSPSLHAARGLTAQLAREAAAEQPAATAAEGAATGVALPEDAVEGIESLVLQQVVNALKNGLPQLAQCLAEERLVALRVGRES